MNRISSSQPRGGLEEAIKPQAQLTARVLLAGFDAKNLQLLWLTAYLVSFANENVSSQIVLYGGKRSLAVGAVSH
jgi:hypothetical protein